MKAEMKKKVVGKDEIVVIEKGRDEKADGYECCWGSFFYLI